MTYDEWCCFLSRHTALQKASRILLTLCGPCFKTWKHISFKKTDSESWFIPENGSVAGFYSMVKQESPEKLTLFLRSLHFLDLSGNEIGDPGLRSWQPSLYKCLMIYCTYLQFTTSCLARFSCCTAKRTIHQSTGFWQSQTKICWLSRDWAAQLLDLLACTKCLKNARISDICIKTETITADPRDMVRTWLGAPRQLHWRSRGWKSSNSFAKLFRFKAQVDLTCFACLVSLAKYTRSATTHPPPQWDRW